MRGLPTTDIPPTPLRCIRRHSQRAMPTPPALQKSLMRSRAKMYSCVHQTPSKRGMSRRCGCSNLEAKNRGGRETPHSPGHLVRDGVRPLGNALYDVCGALRRVQTEWEVSVGG